MNLNDDVVYRRLRLGPLGQRHPGRSGGLVRHYDRFHLGTSLYPVLAYTAAPGQPAGGHVVARDGPARGRPARNGRRRLAAMLALTLPS
jgi:hypothetical protein